jgi:hypothetical protein
VSGAVTSLPPEVAALLTQSCLWEVSSGPDGYGQMQFAPGLTLSCWIEQRSITEGYEMMRGPDEWPILPSLSLYFNGDDEEPRLFTLNDRFSVYGYPAAQRLQPASINPFYGPNFDNRNPWLVEVMLSLK